MHASAAASRSTKKKTKDDLIEKAFAKLLSSNYDECDVVGNNVACKLRRMDEDQRAYAEHLINNILFYGYRKKLNNNSEISLDEKLYEGLSLNNQPINHHCQSSRQRKQCVSPIYQELYNRSSSSAVESWPNSCWIIELNFCSSIFFVIVDVKKLFMLFFLFLRKTEYHYCVKLNYCYALRKYMFWSRKSLYLFYFINFWKKYLNSATISSRLLTRIR